MPDCNIRNIDESLMRAMKVKAAESGLTLRDWVIHVLSFNVGWQRPVEALPVIDRSVSDAPASEDCPVCDSPMVLWDKPPHQGKWACRECDKAYTPEQLRKAHR